METKTTYRVIGIVSVGLLTIAAIGAIAEAYHASGLLFAMICGALGIIGVLSLEADMVIEQAPNTESK